MDRAERWAPPGERVIWSSKPHPAFIVLRRAGLLLVLAAAAIGAAAIGGAWAAWSAVVLGAAALMLVGWSALVWVCETYALTEGHAVWASGVVRRLVVQTPLHRVQNVAVYRSLPERVLGLGTVGLATAGTDGFELVWSMVPGPSERVGEVNGAIRVARGHKDEHSARGPGGGAGPARRLPVIGLVGGIGAGKSEVARALERLGCTVVDSDAQARAALDEPAVRDAVRSWWGPGVIGENGRVDRRAVSRIVFTDPEQRRRLEELVHPLVRAARAEVVQRERTRARAEGAPRALVIDAPLLYEAGADSECDAVLFVDAPRELRLERVARSRGWDEPELARREAAQMPADEKRRRADAVVVNAGSLDELAGAVAAALGELEARLGGRGAIAGGG